MVSSPKNENSVIIYSPSSCSKPLCVPNTCEHADIKRNYRAARFWEYIFDFSGYNY